MSVAEIVQRGEPSKNYSSYGMASTCELPSASPGLPGAANGHFQY